MRNQIVFMFSGQGSQYYQMGKELYEKDERFRYWMNHCEKLVQPLLGISLIDIIYNKYSKSEPFDRLLYSNPALVAIEFSLAKTLIESDIIPDYLLGYSLGEIIALIISGVITLENGFNLVIDLARDVETKTHEAEMIAVLESETIVQEEPGIFEKSFITGKNFPGNFIITGCKEEMNQVQNWLKKRNVAFQKLPVKYGFHTGMIDSIQETYKQSIKCISFSSPLIPIMSSAKKGIMERIDENYCWDVLRLPIDFANAIHTIIQKNNFTFIDVGPSGTLATFVKYLLPSNSTSIPLQTINPFGKDISSLTKLKESLCKVSYN